MAFSCKSPEVYEQVTPTSKINNNADSGICEGISKDEPLQGL